MHGNIRTLERLTNLKVLHLEGTNVQGEVLCSRSTFCFMFVPVHNLYHLLKRLWFRNFGNLAALLAGSANAWMSVCTTATDQMQDSSTLQHCRSTVSQLLQQFGAAHFHTPATSSFSTSQKHISTTNLSRVQNIITFHPQYCTMTTVLFEP